MTEQTLQQVVASSADAADMHAEGAHNNGRIFFTSGRKEKQILQMQREVEKLSRATRERGGNKPQ